LIFGQEAILLKHLLRIIPQHKIYCELFGGADRCGLISLLARLKYTLINVGILFLFPRDEPEKLLEKFKFLVYSRKLSYVEQFSWHNSKS
jgi:hypothetical protein